jgi:hypothetical protein
MKKKIFTFLFSAALLTTACNQPAKSPGKVQKPNADELPDSATSTYFRGLQKVNPEDTAFDHLTLTLNNQTLSLKNFVAAERYKIQLREFHEQKVPTLTQPLLEPEYAPFLRLSELQMSLLDFFEKLREKAIPMCSDYASFNDGKTPKQTKIAYVWDSKDFSTRSQPDNDCPYLAYGLDCSGFIYQIFKQNGVVFSMDSNNADHERQVPYLNGYLQPLHFFAHDLGKITSFNTGDIIYFLNASKKKASHIGIVLVSDKNVVSFFATSGGTQCNNDKDCCNININSGPQILKLGKIQSDGREWGVVRISTTP